MAENNNEAGQPQKQIQLRITDDILKGIYANMVMVSHGQEEFIMDFINVYPVQGQGVINSRVIVSPQHMKRIAAVLQAEVKKYEDRFGKVEASPEPQHNFGFRTE